MNLSILVVSRTHKLLNRMLQSLKDDKYLNNNKFEILCSWNGELKDLQKIKIPQNFDMRIKELKPYNFAKNMNKLASYSRGKYLLLINDDVILDQDSIKNGVSLINKNDKIGLVGGNLRDRNNLLTHAGVNFNIFNSAYHFL